VTLVVPSSRVTFRALELLMFVNVTVYDAAGSDPPMLNETGSSTGDTVPSSSPANADVALTSAANATTTADFKLRIRFSNIP
jgi:hypothetical protein